MMILEMNASMTMIKKHLEPTFLFNVAHFHVLLFIVFIDARHWEFL